MKQQQTWRGTFQVTEQLNGYYRVITTTRFEGGKAGAPVTYPNLSWAETCDLLHACMADWTIERGAKWQSTVGGDWIQLRMNAEDSAR